jgi:HK97 family phage major capsid protein
MPDLRIDLKRVEDDLTELRKDRGPLLKARNDARDEFAKIEDPEKYSPESEHFKAAQEAVKNLGELDDKINGKQQVQIGILKMLGQDDSNGNTPSPERHHEDARMSGEWDYKAFLNDEKMTRLKAMSGSRGRFGTVDLGEAFDRDVMKADITGTTNARRSSFGGVAPPARRSLSLLDLIPTGTMDGNSLPYVQEGGSYAAAETTEGQAKPEAGVTLTDAQADAATIAHWKKILKQALEDQAAIGSIIDSHLRYGVLRRLEGQIIAGNGTAPNLRGIRATAGIQTQAFPGTGDNSMPTLLLQAIAKVFVAEGEADASVVNPVEWAGILGAREGGTTGAYLVGGPNAPTASGITQTLWGVPLLPNASQPAGFATVGDWGMGCTLLIRSGVNVLLSDSDQDDFIKNRVTMLGEMRAALPVWRPGLFVDADLVTP